MYETWNAAKARKELIRVIGGEGFVEEATPSHGVEYDWHGFGYNAVNNTMNANNQLMTVFVGAGSFSPIALLFGGMAAATGGVINDSALIETGDGTNPIPIYNASEDPFYRARFQIPIITDVIVRFGLYQDTNNWVGIYLNTGVGGNWYFNTWNGGAQTAVSLGGSDANWHEVHFGLTTTRAWCSLDGAASVQSTTNITASNLLVFAYVETLANAVRSVNFRNIKVLQDQPT